MAQISFSAWVDDTVNILWTNTPAYWIMTSDIYTKSKITQCPGSLIIAASISFSAWIDDTVIILWKNTTAYCKMTSVIKTNS